MRDLIGYCGLDCEKCDAFIATKTNDDVLREKTAKLWAEYNNAPITPDMINCDGCRVDGRKTPYCESLCEIRQCALAKDVLTCGSCDDVDVCEIVGAVFSNSDDARNNLKG